MSTPFENPKSRYTYADVLKWDENVRAEIIDGELFMMSPPSTAHQRVLTKLLTRIAGFLEGKPCEVYPAPFGVRLFPLNDLSDNTLVEPDITVVCDPSKIDKQGCNGAPDFIIEILSPSTASHDMLNKFQTYLQAGVREYWIVDPERKTVHACILQDKQYVVSIYDGKDTIPVTVLPGCIIDMQAIFAG